jgi:CRP-like cAMP-binding protein
MPKPLAIVRSSDESHLGPLFHGVPRQVQERILSLSSNRSVFARSILANQDDPADYMFLLKHGTARHFFITVDGKKTLLLWLRPGDVLGAAALLHEPSTYVVSTEMVEDGEVAVWRRDTICRLAAEYPALLNNALAIAANYLVWYVAAHSALLSRSAQQRLTHVLTTLAAGIGRKVRGGVQLDISNEELANAANVTQFTASRLISHWQRAGAVEKRRGKLLLRDPKRLVAFVADEVVHS